jgi:hypothetical protein
MAICPECHTDKPFFASRCPQCTQEIPFLLQLMAQIVYVTFALGSLLLVLWLVRLFFG